MTVPNDIGIYSFLPSDSVSVERIQPLLETVALPEANLIRVYDTTQCPTYTQ